MSNPNFTTWDGLPVSQEKPHGASILVYRRENGTYAFLILHRAHTRPKDGGNWAWTPPAGSRLPGETVDACVRRELWEETGLTLTPRQTDYGTEAWAVYSLEVPFDTMIRLDYEHDRFQWVSLDEAVRRCLPEVVSAPFLRLGTALGLI